MGDIMNTGIPWLYIPKREQVLAIQLLPNCIEHACKFIGEMYNSQMDIMIKANGGMYVFKTGQDDQTFVPFRGYLVKQGNKKVFKVYSEEEFKRKFVLEETQFHAKAESENGDDEEG